MLVLATAGWNCSARAMRARQDRAAHMPRMVPPAPGALRRKRKRSVSGAIMVAVVVRRVVPAPAGLGDPAAIFVPA